MAFPSILSTTTTLAPTADPATTSHLISLPATVASGNLLLAAIQFCELSNTAFTVTTPSGWTLILANQAGGRRMQIYAKKSDGTEGGTTVDFVTSIATFAAAQVFRITGWRDSGTLANDVEAIGSSGTASQPDPAALNPTNWDVEDTKWMVFTGRANAHDTTGYPSQYTGGLQTRTAALGANISSAHRDSQAASEDPGVFTAGGAVMSTNATVAIRPSNAPVTNRYAIILQSFVQVPAAPPVTDPRRAVILMSNVLVPDAHRRAIILQSNVRVPDPTLSGFPAVRNVVTTVS